MNPRKHGCGSKATSRTCTQCAPMWCVVVNAADYGSVPRRFYFSCLWIRANSRQIGLYQSTVETDLNRSKRAELGQNQL